MRYGHLAQRLFNTPLAIHPAKAEVIVSALAERMGIGSVVRMAEDVKAFSGDDSFSREGDTYWEEGYDVVQGVARIEIAGTTVNKLGTMRPYSGMTGYDGLRESFAAALADRDARAIMLDIDSPGGEVCGLFDLVDDIYSARGTKPVWAILTESAYSAGYALASSADRIIVPRTGGTGSIGCIWMHCDFSRAIKDAGITVTIVQSGTRKAEGAQEIPLSKEALAHAQADIDTIGRLFEGTVARNRGLNATAIREMQAATFLGAEGVALGLADEIMAPDAAFRALLDEIK
jgi:ClpP class serine protease